MSTTGRDEALELARSLSAFAGWLGWGLLGLGLLLGLGPMVGASASQEVRIKAAVDGICWILALGLAGRITALACRLIAAVITARIERHASDAEQWIAQATRGVDLLERLVQVRGSTASETAPDHNAQARRALLLAEIDRAIGLEHWAETESLIDAFAHGFPEDSGLIGLRERLKAARQRAVQEQLAQLDAAQKVNDPARVIELYQGLVPSIESERRDELSRDLAKWFLELIHRRLRTGKIQAEVVLLATQVAETFGTTMEGASMRAALPTLRRSVGLCPRCAQPYLGTADACSQCLAGTSGVAASSPTEPPKISA
ncbi:MAG: hypothetical protein ACLQGP_28320 [Isosphaeraceae bacterium]